MSGKSNNNSKDFNLESVSVGAIVPIEEERANPKRFHSLCRKLAELDQAEMHYSWSEDSWEQLIGKLGEYCLAVARVEEGEILGVAVFHRVKRDSVVHLLKIFVRSHYRKLGIGRKIMDWAVKEYSVETEVVGAERIFLEVDCENIQAVNFYSRYGFKKLVRAKNFYSDGKDAWRMEMAIH